MLNRFIRTTGSFRRHPGGSRTLLRRRPYERTFTPTPEGVGGHEILNGDGQGTERWRPRELRGGGHRICFSD